MKREEPDSLADWTRRTRGELGLSLLDVERQSARAGLRIAGSYVSRIENGFAKNPSKDKLIALAKGLGKPEEEVFAAAKGVSVKSDHPATPVDVHEMKLLLMYRSLPAWAREHMMEIAQAMQRVESRRAKRTA